MRCGVLIGAENVSVVPDVFSNGVTHMRVKCGLCGRLGRSIPQPPDVHRVMPFGKYKGEEAIEIVRKDKGYAEWVVKNIDSGSLASCFEEALKKL